MEPRAAAIRLKYIADYLRDGKHTPAMDTTYAHYCEAMADMFKAIDSADDGLTRARVLHAARWAE